MFVKIDYWIAPLDLISYVDTMKLKDTSIHEDDLWGTERSSFHLLVIPSHSILSLCLKFYLLN